MSTWQRARAISSRLGRMLREPRRTAVALVSAFRHAFRAGPEALPTSELGALQAGSPREQAAAIADHVRGLIEEAEPLSLPTGQAQPWHVPGTGAYLRLDYWASGMISGGSYGHTCYVADQLARGTGSFVCFMAHRYELLDELGLRQVVLEPAALHDTELARLTAPLHYLRILRPALEALAPAYLYERLVPGNWAIAQLSARLRIPYIVEYNGSERSMRRSFSDHPPSPYEEHHALAEQAAFAQASLISVVSEPIREDLIARGVDPARILVNPNGADPAVYAPADAATRAALRAELGIEPGATVLGFSGTFGGWHGIDVLASALPRILAELDGARVLLIGDGARKHDLDKALERSGATARVISTGRVGQQRGAELLKAIDLYLSPHDSHMADGRFFGSPTKLFEYMGMAGGIVASDLEQLGDVLSPALRANHLDADTQVRDERAVLCTPGNADELVRAACFLARNPDIAAALGHNARRALEEHYSWERHVARLWSHARGVGGGLLSATVAGGPEAAAHGAKSRSSSMRIEFVTLFEEAVRGLAAFGVVGRAVASGLVEIGTVDPRAYTDDVHGTVDDRPYGGGPGMVMMVAPLMAAIAEARRRAPDGSPCVFLTPQGRVLDQALVRELAQRPGLILVAGRYEGPDERVIELEADYEVSIGDYVLSGGELPAMVLADAVARRVPGVLGAAESAAQDSFEEGLLDCPHYTRPETVAGRTVPSVLLSGDHGAIRRWRLKQALGRTWLRRPELLKRLRLDAEHQTLLEEFVAEHEAGQV